MPKNKKWFKQVRSSYIPRSWQGWLLYIPFTGYLALVLAKGFDSSFSVAESILFIFPQFITAGVLMTFIADKKS